MALIQITLLPMHQTAVILLLMLCAMNEEAAWIFLGTVSGHSDYMRNSVSEAKF